MARASPTATPLRYRLARSAVLFGGVDVASRVGALLLSVVTARVLGPADVGVLGVAVTVVTILSVAGFYWETAATIADASRSDGSLAISAMIARTLTACVAVVVVGALSSMLGERLTSSAGAAGHAGALLSILIWTLVIEALSTYPRVILQRRLSLPLLAWLQLFAVASFVGGAVLLLHQGFGTHGVVWAQLTSAAACALLTWTCLRGCEWEPPSWEALHEVARGAGRLFVGGFMSFLGTRADNLLVAGAVGETGMAYYSMAYNGSRVPVGIVDKVTSSVLTPTLARIRGDGSQVQHLVDRMVRYLHLAALPASAGLLVCAPLIVPLLLGERWIPMVPSFRLMSLVVVAAPVLYTSSAVLVAFGRGHWIALPSVALVAFQLLFIPPTARRWGPTGAAAVDVGSAALVTTLTWFAARRAAPSVVWHWRDAIRAPLIAATVAGGLGATCSLLPWNRWIVLPCQAAVIVSGYVVAIILLGSWRYLAEVVSVLRNATAGGLAGRPRP